MRLKLLITDDSLLNFYTKAVQEYNMKVKTTNSKYTDAGFDLFLPEDVVNDGEKLKKINHRVKAVVTNDGDIDNSGDGDGDGDGVVVENSCAYYLYPRSSISKTPFRLANSVGIIDSGYRGELIGVVDCFTDRQHGFTCKKGDRLFQICSPTLESFTEVIIVDTLDSTERGEGGFGSTGN